MQSVDKMRNSHSTHSSIHSGMSTCTPTILNISELSTHPRKDFPFTGAFKGFTWNCRSLLAAGSTQKLEFVTKLMQHHDFCILTETRLTDQRMHFRDSKICSGFWIQSTYIDQYKGGVTIMIKKRFLDLFDLECSWEVIEQG